LALAGPARAQIGGLVPETARPAAKSSSTQPSTPKREVQPASLEEPAALETAQLPAEPYYEGDGPILSDDLGSFGGMESCGLEGCGPGGSSGPSRTRKNPRRVIPG
jgi:hypothetical protein